MIEPSGTRYHSLEDPAKSCKQHLEKHIEFLKKFAPRYLPKEILKKFNNRFDYSLKKCDLKRLFIEHNIVHKKRDPNSTWTKKQIQYLQELACVHDLDTSRNLFNEKFGTSRTKNAITLKSRKLGITWKKKSTSTWSSKMDTYLRSTAEKNSLYSTTILFNKKFSTHFSDTSIRKRCKNLSLQLLPNARYVWTEDKILFLEQTAPKHTLQKTTKLFNRKFQEEVPSCSIQSKCRQMNIQTRNTPFWSEKKIAILKELGKTHTLEECAKIFNEKYKQNKSLNAYNMVFRANKLSYITRQTRRCASDQNRAVTEELDIPLLLPPLEFDKELIFADTFSKTSGEDQIFDIEEYLNSIY